VGRAFQKGLLLLGCGKSSLRLAPPLVVDEYDVDTALRIIDECCARCRTSIKGPCRCRTPSRASCATATSSVIEGFTHLISFAAGHEIIRQRRRDLTLCRLTPDLIYDQMIAAGLRLEARVFVGWQSGVGSLHAFRRAVEGRELAIEEYSHFGMVARFSAGAARLPFWTLRDYEGTDLPRVNPRIKVGDVSVHRRSAGDGAGAQPRRDDCARPTGRRAGKHTDLGTARRPKGSGLCLRRVIVVVEELVDESVIRRTPIVR